MRPGRAPFKLQSQAASTAGTYALFAFLWILFSDWILAALVSDLRLLSLFQTLKGWLFVVVTTALVYTLVHRHVAKLLEAEAELQGSKERYREVVEGTDDLIIQVDESGRLVYVNHSSHRYFGLSPSECSGLSAFDFVHTDDRERSREWFQHCVENRTRCDNIENRQVSRTGKITSMLWTVNFSYQFDGSFAGCRAIARDISERKKVEQALHENLRLKSEFISTAAHELRTPLTAVMGYSELLMKESELGAFSPQQKAEFIATIHEKAEILTHTVDDLLDLSRIDSGQRVPLEIRPCNLIEVITKAVAEFKLRLPGRSFQLHLSQDCLQHCWADPGRMRQVIENLLDNAVKYSPPQGDIAVACAHHPDHCRISVTDQGIGMSQEQVTKIFDKFYRADASDTAVGGLGLGLSIVRHIIEGHGGRVEVRSEVGKGSEVTVLLPHKHLKSVPEGP